MTKTWYKAYDAGVPYEIDLNEYSSINEMLEMSLH